MKKLMLAGALLLNVTGLAQATDMPLKALAPPPPAFTWTGIYGGGYIGGMWAKTDSNFVFPPPSSWEQSASVGIGGGIVGIQYQWGNLVLGAEGNVGGVTSNSLGTSSCAPNCPPGAAITATSPNAIFSAGGRVGWAFGYWLPYVSGGYANAATFAQTFSAPNFRTEIGRTSPDGGYVGGGLDWAVWGGGLVVGLEYRHYDFRTEQVTPVNPVGAGDLFNTYDTQTKFDTFTFRATYLFSPK